MNILKRIDHTRLSVQNLEQSKEWYAIVLGMRPSIDIPNYVEFRVGQSGIALASADDKAPYSTGGQVAYWNVDNLDQAIGLFKKHGAVVYRGPLDIEDGKTICQIQDPFGNVLGLIGRVSPNV